MVLFSELYLETYQYLARTLADFITAKIVRQIYRESFFEELSSSATSLPITTISGHLSEVNRNNFILSLTRRVINSKLVLIFYPVLGVEPAGASFELPVS